MKTNVNKEYTIQRIEVPMYRIGRRHYNEYEVRQLMLDVAKGIAPKGIKVTYVKSGETAYITETGHLTEKLPGFDISGTITLKHIAVINKRKGE
jgi:hypothetical protein